MGARAGRNIAAFVLALGILAVARPASATPAFARQTGMGCPTCHEEWPRLNDFGELYRDNGYQLPGRAEAPPLSPDTFPIAARVAALYDFEATPGIAPTDGGTGAFRAPEANLFVGGALANNVAALVEIQGFGPDGLAAIEQASVRLSNVLDTSWLNLRVGLLQLDLPNGAHRSLSLLSSIALYEHHPAGSTNLFELGREQLGIEVMGHSSGAGLRYSVSVVNANGSIGTRGAFSAPTAFAHVTGTFFPFAMGLTRVRLGAFGAVGAWPTRFASTTMPPMPTPGTGSELRPFATVGAELGATLGPMARPFGITLVGTYGFEDAGLVTNGTRAATYLAGSAELVYTPALNATLFGRYGFVRALQAADPTQLANAGDSDNIVVGARWSLVQSRSAAVTVHTEGSWLLSAAFPGGPPTRQLVLGGGFDVAL